MKNQTPDYGKYMKPKLLSLLASLGLDYEVRSANGTTLIVEEKGKEIEVLDFICGYGSCLMGHNNPSLKRTWLNELNKNMPIHAQLSNRVEAGKLAELLNAIAFSETGKNYKVIFSNTGSEAVETAIKHVLLAYENRKQTFINQGLITFNREAQQKSLLSREEIMKMRDEWIVKVNFVFAKWKPLFIALKNSYHGQSLGALGLTSNSHYRSAFESSLLNCYFINPEDIKWKELNEKACTEVPVPLFTIDGKYYEENNKWNLAVGIFAEPILGEGGIFPLSNLANENLQKISNELHVPVIWDEIQTGCFRTGKLLASAKEENAGAYYLLGKALGGGMVKISALLIEENQYINDFDLMHVSTFAEDELSCKIAQEFLSIASQQKERIVQISNELYSKMEQIANKYNHVIKEVRIRGLLVGIEFHDMNLSGSYGFQGLSRSGYFNYILSAWIYSHYKIRVSAPLSNMFTIRLHVPAIVKQSEIEKFYTALSHLCELISNEDLYALLDFLLPKKWQNLRKSSQNFTQPKLVYAGKVDGIPIAGFITHYIDVEGVYACDPSLKVLPPEGIEALLYKIRDFFPLVVITGSKVIPTETGPVLLVMTGTSFTSAMAKKAMVNHELSALRSVIQQSVNLLEKEGAEIIGLGQYSSILTQNGKCLQTEKAQITTGNAFTTSLATNLVLNEVQEKLVFANGLPSLAVVGGKGNIGAAMVEELKPHFNEIVLFIDPDSKSIERRKSISSEDNIRICKNLKELINFSVVLIATNQSESFIKLEHLQKEAIVCDVSVPSALDPEVNSNPGNRIIFYGGLASIPGALSVPSKGFPLPPGEIYGCMAETLILAAHRRPDLASLGKVDVSTLRELKELGALSGIKLINTKMLNVL